MSELNKYISQECNPGPYIANTYVWKTVFRQDNVINVWRLVKIAPDTHHKYWPKYRITKLHNIKMTQALRDLWGGRGRKALRGCNTDAYTKRYRRQSTHALVWTLTYLHLNFNGSKFFRSHTHGNSKEWRSGEKISSWRTFFPLSFQFNVSNIVIDYRSRKVCQEF